MVFQTQVRLVPATVPLLNALNEDRAVFGGLMGSPVPDGWPEFPEAIGFTLEHLQNAPAADHGWSMQFFVEPETGRLLGSGGFAARPVDRAVEIGYEIAPEFRGHGFGTAAARALVEHAVASGEVDHVIAKTRPGPNASTGVLVSLGFEHVADQEGPRDRHGLGVEMDSPAGRVAQDARPRSCPKTAYQPHIESVGFPRS
jgi:RimJ/RimL family protein N-acetyltransferase